MATDGWLRKRGWSRPIGESDLIVRKLVDRALLNGEATIPADFQQYFHAANNNQKPKAGSFLRVDLMVDGQPYAARLSHVRYSESGRKESLQIRWEGNDDLLALLRREFASGDDAGRLDPVKGTVDVASRMGYVDFLRTERPLVYRLELSSRRLSAETAAQASALEALEIAIAKGQGFNSDASANRAIEMHAMGLALAHFEEQGFRVEDVSADHPYDLECTHQDGVLFVEVKGTQSAGKQVLLTGNEVKFARLNAASMVLFIVSGVELGANGKPSGGRVEVIRPWTVDEGVLVPYGYTYSPHGGNAASGDG